MRQNILHVGTAGTSVEVEGFESFFEADYQRLCQALYLLTGDRFEAEEVAQEAMTRVLERWDRVRVMQSPTGYAFRTALNIQRNRVRRLAVRARRVFVEAPVADHGPLVDDREDVRRAMATLPASQRETLVLIDWLDLDTDEVAQVLQLTPNAVRVRLHRARSALRESLGGSR
jgi:RNA polymerase sigma-70 factor (ECF subfamily)